MRRSFREAAGQQPKAPTDAAAPCCAPVFFSFFFAALLPHIFALSGGLLCVILLLFQPVLPWKRGGQSSPWPLPLSSDAAACRLKQSSTKAEDRGLTGAAAAAGEADLVQHWNLNQNSYLELRAAGCWLHTRKDATHAGAGLGAPPPASCFFFEVLDCLCSIASSSIPLLEPGAIPQLLQAIMTSLQIQSFASLIDQLPIGVEESERIDQAASAASCSGVEAEEGCLDRALGITERKHGGVTRRDCAKAACIECPQGVAATAVGCPSDEALTNGLVYGTTPAFPAVSFSATAEEAPCMQQIHDASPASLAAGGCADPSSIADPSLLAASSPFFSEHPSAGQQQQAAATAAASLRAFPSQEGCSVVGPGQLSFGPYCSEEASPPVFAGGGPHASGYSPLDLAAGRTNAILEEQGYVGSGWPHWGQSCPSASDCKYTPAPLSRACSERFSAPPSQSLRSSQASHGGGQLQVSIVSPVVSFLASELQARSRQTCSPANIKVKSVSPSGPDHFVLCLEGESGQEQHVSIDRQELLLVASAEVHALAERDNTKTPTGSRSSATKGAGMIYGGSSEEGQQEIKGGGGKGLLGGPLDGRCDKWNQDVGRWQHQMCRELELQKRRLQQREEACRQREEEFRLREDEARRQKLTIAALEGEVLKVTEEMQEILLQKEEGRLIVQREFLGELRSRGVMREGGEGGGGGKGGGGRERGFRAVEFKYKAFYEAL
ncbi:hypothetical protein Emag_005553 [Eimeria magna]